MTAANTAAKPPNDIGPMRTALDYRPSARTATDGPGHRAQSYGSVPLEVFLTGRSAEAVKAGPRCGKLVASAGDHDVVVLTVSDELMEGLAAAGSEQLAAAAASWSQFEDFQGADTSGLAGFLGELAGLTRRATARKEHLYCMIACLPSQEGQRALRRPLHRPHAVE